MHCDTVLMAREAGKNLRDFDGHINIEKLKAGGCLAQCFALFIPSYDILDTVHFMDTGFRAIYSELLGKYRDSVKSCADALRPAYSAADIIRNEKAGYISSILTVEDGALLLDDLKYLDTMYRDGVRMLALTWNYENCIGFPNSPDDTAHKTRGLKPFGFETIEKMNSLGMIIDVSHLSEAGFFDVAKSSKKPFVASHSCCRALCGHQRNLTDEQLRTMGDCGGIVGVNFYSKFLSDGSYDTNIEDIVRHVKHIKNKAGIGSVSWGSDFDGFDESQIEFSDYSGFPLILDALSKEFTDDEIDMISRGNFLRVFGAQ